MDNKINGSVRVLIGVIAALLFVVFIFAFFTFSENEYVANYNDFRNIFANATIPQSSSSQKGMMIKVPGSSEDASSEESLEEEADSASESGSSETESSSKKRPSSSGEASSEKEVSSSEKEVSSSGESESPSAESSADSEEDSSSAEQEGELIPILGKQVLTKEQLLEYCSSHRAGMKLTCSLEELIEHYLTIGERYGLRGDIAFLQAINETGWFRYNRPSSYLVYKNGKWVRVYEPRPEGLYVVAEDNNFCGLGVTGRLGDEDSICRFETAALGVEAQIQHLYAYACEEPLPSGTERIDTRFDFVTRGCAPNWNDLGDGN